MIHLEFNSDVITHFSNPKQQGLKTHLTGFKTAFTQVMNVYARELGILKEKDQNFTGADIEYGGRIVKAGTAETF